MVNKEKKEANYYKYATFALFGILVLYGVYYGFTSYKSSVFEDGFIAGQNNAVIGMLNVVGKDGYISFTNEANATLTLVPTQELQKVRDGTIEEIMSFVKKEGYVSLYTNETELVLVEYKAPAQQSNTVMPAEQ